MSEKKAEPDTAEVAGAQGALPRETVTGKGISRRARDLLIDGNLLVLLAVLVFVGSQLSPHFLTSVNIFNLLQQASIIGIVAVGMTFVILTAGIDLSVGSMLALSGMACATVMTWGFPWPAAVLLGILVGTVFGLLQGVIIAFGAVPSFIITLAGLTALRGATYLTSDGAPITLTDPDFRLLGAGYIGGVPIVGIIFLVVAAVSILVLRYTAFGQYVYAVGGSEETARLSGVPVTRVKIAVFAISGGLAGLAGVLLASYLSVGQPSAGGGYELTAIAAVVLGGTSLFGGAGGIMGTIVAVFLLGTLTNIFNLLGISSYFQQISTGVILAIAVLLNRFLEKRRHSS